MSKVAVPVPAAKVEVREDPVIAPVVSAPPLVAPPVVVKVEVAPVPPRAKKPKSAAKKAEREAQSNAKKAAAEAFRAEQAEKKAERMAEEKRRAEEAVKSAFIARKVSLADRVNALPNDAIVVTASSRFHEMRALRSRRDMLKMLEAYSDPGDAKFTSFLRFLELCEAIARL